MAPLSEKPTMNERILETADRLFYLRGIRAVGVDTIVEQILGTFDRLERGFASKDFRGCPFVNAVAELGAEDQGVKKIAIAFKESRRVWFRDLLLQLDVADAEGLATQLTLLVDGSIAQDLVRDDPSMARAAKEAARVLLKNAGIEVEGQQAQNTRRIAKKQVYRIK
jgi:hypothetical protein